MTRFRYLLLFLSILTLPSLSFADAKKYCYKPASSDPERSPQAIISTVDSQKTALAVKRSVSKGKILVRDQNDGLDTQFFYQKMDDGDCILTNPDEKTHLDVAYDDRLLKKDKESFLESLNRWKIYLWGHYKTFVQTDLFPIVLLKNKIGLKLFGYIDVAYLAQLKLDGTQAETSTKTVLDYSGKYADLLLIYILCPPAREEVCKLKIKKNGKWVLDDLTKKYFEIPVLARSNQDFENPTKRSRLQLGGDTPQGIYYLWATLFSDDLGYGQIPRIDIDAVIPPVNSTPFNQNSYVLSELLPESSLNDYWVNEWPLAYQLGRSFLRIHGNSIDPEDPSNYTTPTTHLSFRTTNGCINTGNSMKLLLQKLVELDVLSPQAIVGSPSPNPQTLEWSVSAKLGRAFVITKDNPH